MAAKGSVLKAEITQKILSMFPGAFCYDKEIRIPGVEGSDNLQIKVTLTCAKTNVENSENDTVPWDTTAAAATNHVPTNFMNEPTAEEKQAVADLINKLGLN